MLYRVTRVLHEKRLASSFHLEVYVTFMIRNKLEKIGCYFCNLYPNKLV